MTAKEGDARSHILNVLVNLLESVVLKNGI